MARLMGIDYGAKYVGLALTDEEGRVGMPEGVLENNDRMLPEITGTAHACKVARIVLGYSQDNSGIDNPLQWRINRFADTLERKGFEVVFVPEFYTSAEARRVREDPHARVDAQAAAILLNYYLSRTQPMQENTDDAHKAPESGPAAPTEHAEAAAAPEGGAGQKTHESLEGKISIDQFKQVEMKIGAILSAEIVPDADKLLKLAVDVGEEKPRQIVSGIRAYFPEPDVLVGVRCPFVTNLQPRTIKGLESNGMILAAHDEAGVFSLLRVDQSIAPGTPLS